MTEQKVNYQVILDKELKNIERNGKIPVLLLHVCCAPCSSYVLEYLNKYFRILIYFYNPNIFPSKEYEYRLNEVKRLVEEMPLQNPVEVIEGKYEPEIFYNLTKGLETEPERGERCRKCISQRLKQAAYAAKELNAPKPAAQPSAPAAKSKLKTAKPEPAESAEKPAAKKKPEGKPVSKKPANKKGIIIIAAVAAVVIIAAVAIAALGNANTNVSTGMMSASLEETASLRTFTLNGTTLELPAPVQTLLDKGWVFEDAQYDTATIEAGGSKSSVMLMNEYGKIELRLSNTTLNEQPASACTITAVSAVEHILNDNYLGANGNEFKTANGITLGASSAEVKTAYPAAKKDGGYLKLETPYADIRCYNYDNNLVS